MGIGFPISYSTKQKLDTQGSTESESFLVDEFMPGIIWTRNFLKDQQYGVTADIFSKAKKGNLFYKIMVRHQLVREQSTSTFIFCDRQDPKGGDINGMVSN